MGLYNSFIKSNGDDVQVKCFDTMGGVMDCYHLGQPVPTHMLDEEYNIVREYGENFNIFPYTTNDDVILVRDGRYEEAVDYNDLLKYQVENIKCIDKFGRGLNVNTPNDYWELKNETGKYKKSRF
jgi:hypothetical protein